eukprot:UN13376
MLQKPTEREPVVIKERRIGKVVSTGPGFIAVPEHDFLKEHRKEHGLIHWGRTLSGSCEGLAFVKASLIKGGVITQKIGGGLNTLKHEQRFSDNSVAVLNNSQKKWKL